MTYLSVSLKPGERWTYHPPNYSVHTSAEALRLAETEIRRIGQQLRAKGTI